MTTPATLINSAAADGEATAARLNAYLMQACARPFSWAEHNCCHFAGGWVREVEGRDPLAGMPPLNGERSARRLVRWLGGLAEAVTLRLEREPIAPARARVGDVVLLPLSRVAGGHGNCVGICVGPSAALGAQVAVYLTEQAAIYWPVADATHAWRIGSAQGA